MIFVPRWLRRRDKAGKVVGRVSEARPGRGGPALLSTFHWLELIHVGAADLPGNVQLCAQTENEPELMSTQPCVCLTEIVLRSPFYKSAHVSPLIAN